MGVVGRLDQYASMLAWEFDETTANGPRITGFGTYYATEFNENIVDIVRGGLVLNLDAGNLASYAGIGTTAFDLSGNNNNGTLINGVGYTSSNGGSLVFDGTNDYVSGSLGTLNAPFTLEIFGKFNNVSQNNYEYFGSVGDFSENGMISISKIGTQDANSSYHGFMYVYPGFGDPKKTNIDLRTTNYQHLVVIVLSSSPYIRVYKNGVEGSMIDALSAPINTNGNYRIGAWGNNTWWLNGNISKASVYNRALSAAEISQNFNTLATRYGLATTNSTAPMTANVFPPYDPVYDEFGGTLFGAGQGRYMRQNTDKSVIVYNEIDEVTDLFGRGIVRDGLVLDLDAGIPASYPGSGTTWTNLVGGGNNGTLVNGPTYSSANGGSISFDGTDDYSSISHTSTLNPETGSFTFGGFFKTNADALSNYFPTHLSKSQSDWGNGYLIRAVYPYTGSYIVGVSQGGNTGVDRTTVLSTLTASLGVWVNIVGVWNAPSKTLTLYFNGVADGTGTTTNSLTINPTANLEFLRYNRISQSRFEYVNGNIAQVSIYNRALSAAEVSQNFNALRNRFGL